MMDTRTWWWIIIGLFAVIVVMTGFLFAIPGRSHVAPLIVGTATQTPAAADQASSTAPLSSKVMVTAPQVDAHVGHAFTVAGVAPGQWFFEAQFPIQVRETDGSVVGRATGHAQGEWETDKLVTFTANMSIDATFSGKATLILMKDNPSGLPENDDSVEIPITVD